MDRQINMTKLIVTFHNVTRASNDIQFFIEL